MEELKKTYIVDEQNRKLGVQVDILSTRSKKSWRITR